MIRKRYMEWITVWRWFATVDRSKLISNADWEDLHRILNEMWKEERKGATPEELAAHAAALGTFQK